MKIQNYTIVVLLASSSCFMWGQPTNNPYEDDITTSAKIASNSLQLSITTNNPKVQMSFLMQGVNINIKDTTNTYALSFHLPCAKDVREKMLHHPNEVKAMHKHNDLEVRPDLQPLISALNGIPAQITNNDSIISNCKHYIYLDKETGRMSFTISLSMETMPFVMDSLSILIVSNPHFTNAGEEFLGKRYSTENRMPPRGLGNAPDERNSADRKVEIRRTIIVQRNKY